MEQKLIKYRHKDDTSQTPDFFVAFEEDKVPEWAADVQPYVPPEEDYFLFNDIMLDDAIFEETVENEYKDWS